MLSGINNRRSMKYLHNFGGMDFYDIYETYFDKIRNKPLNILEIGAYEGYSLKVWKEYFPKAKIYSLDIDPACKRHEEDRIHVEIGSQTDPAVIQRLVDKAKRFDIVIDDGSHVNKFTLETFKLLFPHVVSRGFYAIEDLHCCYEKLEDVNVREIWPGMKYNSADESLNNDIKDFHQFILENFDNLNYQRKDILSMQFWSRLCMIIKI